MKPHNPLVAATDSPLPHPLNPTMATLTPPKPPTSTLPRSDILTPIRQWFNHIEMRSPRQAHWICKLIPCTCPFERKFTLFGHFFHTPPLCELNPFYNEVVALRFRALTYLSEVCGEDVQKYIC